MLKWTLVVATLASRLLLAAPAADSPLPGPRNAEAVDTVTTVRWGPYTAQGFNDYSSFVFNLGKPCTDCYITGIVPNLVYWDGNPAHASTTANFDTGPMLHHVVAWNSARIDATCGIAFKDRFFASGNERVGMSLPAGYGYYIPSGSTWDGQVHIHNTAAVPKTVYVEVAFSHRSGTDSVKDVRALWLDQNNCPGNSQYPVASGYTDSHWDWTIPSSGLQRIEGAIVAIGGHVHDFGISVAVEKVGTGQWICTATSGYASGSMFDPAAVGSPPRPNNAGHPADDVALTPGDPAYVGHIEEMTTCSTNVSIVPGDVLRLHTQYNATSSIPDVMGIMVAFIYDNCPSVDNPTQANADGDALGDACDADDDNDSWTDGAEGFITTNPLVACTPGGWPPDPQPAPNGNGTVQIDDVAYTAGAFGSTTTHRAEIATQNGTVQIDDIAAFAGRFGDTC